MVGHLKRALLAAALCSAAFLAKAAYTPITYPVIDVVAYQAVGDGTTNNNVPIQAAFTAAANGGLIRFPCGTFKMTAQPTVTIANGANVSIVGSGSGCTTLYMSGPVNGPLINYGGQYSSFSISDMAIVTDQAGGQTGLSLTLSNGLETQNVPINYINNIDFHGYDFASTGNDYWSTGVISVGPSDINFNGGACNMSPTNSTSVNRGTCYSISGYGSGTDPYAVQFNFFGTFMAQANIGLYYGDWVQGVTMTGVNCTNCATGVETGAGGASDVTDILDQLSIANSQFSTTSACIDIEAQYFASLQFSNSLCIANTGNGLQIKGTQIQVTNNSIGSVDGTQGIVITSSFGNGGQISGNSIIGFTTGITANALSTGPMYLDANLLLGSTTDYSVNHSSTGVYIRDEKLQGFSTLPTCGAWLVGSSFKVEGNQNTFLGTISGSGAAYEGAFCNGTNWTAQ